MSFWIGLHLWCGVGWTGGLFPELRLGVLRIGFCQGAIAEHMRQARDRFERALLALGTGSKP